LARPDLRASLRFPVLPRLYRRILLHPHLTLSPANMYSPDPKPRQSHMGHLPCATPSASATIRSVDIIATPSNGHCSRTTRDRRSGRMAITSPAAPATK